MQKFIKKGLRIQINFNYIIYNNVENKKTKKSKQIYVKMAR